jgi:hypothetical protein
MVRLKRIAITTVIGILTGLYCAGSLLFIAPPGVTPEPWFMITIFYSRALQGVLVGFADAIPVHWALRGGSIGALMSLQLCIVPLNAHNYPGAGLLLGAGILYGLIEDGIGSRWAKDEERKPDECPCS